MPILPHPPASGPSNPDVARFDRTFCPICDDAPARMLPAPDPWHLAWCDACRFAFITNPPRYETVASEFEWEQSIGVERQRRWAGQGSIGTFNATVIARLKSGYRTVTRRDKLLAVATTFDLRGDVIDVGCGDGHLWDSLPRGCAPIGIELSPALAAQARARLGEKRGHLIEADALGGLRQLGDAEADGAILISYLEHEADPAVAMRELRRVLRPGAIAILKMPNYACWNRKLRGSNWCGYRFPDHVNYFTPHALRRILASSGFEIVRFGFGDHPPTSDNMWCVARVPMPAMSSCPSTLYPSL